MMFFALGLVAGVVGALPLLVRRHFVGAFLVAGVSGFASWGVFYASPPSLASPFWGGVGLVVVLLWAVSAALVSALEHKVSPTVLFAVMGLVLILARGVGGSSAFHAPAYAGLIGPIENAAWTDATQPKDPKHKSLVPPDLTKWLA